MSLSEVFNNKKTKTVGYSEVNKLIALISLEEALIAEDYEDCAGLIETAQGYGADRREINKVLAGCIRRTNGLPPKRGIVKRSRRF